MRRARRIIKIEYSDTIAFDMGNKIVSDWMDENDKLSVLDRDGNGDVDFTRDELYELIAILDANEDYATANALWEDLDNNEEVITYAIY